MAGLDLAPIHTALADQIRARTQRDWNVSPWPNSGMQAPVIEIWPSTDTYVAYWVTAGPSGVSDVMLRIRVEATGDSAETRYMQVTDFVSVGTGNTSSICDAVMSDPSLGGVVESCVVLSAEWDPTGAEPDVVWFPVSIIARKIGAEV